MISKVGIIGEGKMGTGIFNYLLDFNYELVWICSPVADTEKINRQFGKKIKRSLDAGIIDQSRFDKLIQTHISKNPGDLHDCDLVIEAIPEIAAVKKELFLTLDHLVKPGAIFTSNSSSINPSEITPPGDRGFQFSCLHFFYPVQLKNIAEINTTKKTNGSTVIALESFLQSIQRHFITLDERNSFVLNKIFLDIQNEAYLIVKADHCSVPQMDHLVRQTLFSFGIFDFCDSVGIDTMLASVTNYTRDYPHRDYYASFIAGLNKLVMEGKFGIKSQEGFYKYPMEEVLINDFPASDSIAEHLRQTWLSASKRFAAQTHLPIEDMNRAIKEYFGTENGPFG